MINFYDKVNRLFKIQVFLIKKHIFGDNGVNYDLLKTISSDLSYQSLIDKGLRSPVFSLLHNHYEKGRNIDDYITDPNLYLSEREKLTNQGIIEVIEDKDNWISFPIIKIIDEKGFNEFTHKIKKQFAFFILFNKRTQFLKSLLDDISKKGPFSNDEIQRIYNDINISGIKMQKYINQNKSNNIKNISSTTKTNIDIHKTFYLNKVRDQPTILDSSNNFLEAFLILKNNDLINNDTGLIDFKKIFQSTELKEDELIEWKGSLIELKWLVQQICRKGICNHIYGKEKWLVAMNCFKIKNKDKQWVKIDKYTKISNANGIKKNKPLILNFGEKLMFL